MSARTLRRHPISECSASTPDRRRRPGSAPGPPAPALRRLGPGPPLASSSSNSESSEQLPSIAPRWLHSESLGPEFATTWPALSRRAALRSSIAGVSCRADGCLPSDGRARSESVSASCAMVVWALSMVLIDLPFSHWTHVTFKHGVRRATVPLCSRRRCDSTSGRRVPPVGDRGWVQAGPGIRVRIRVGSTRPGRRARLRADGPGLD